MTIATPARSLILRTRSPKMGLLALFSGLPLATALAAGFAAWLLYAVNAAIYNLFFHPLSRFPGPRAAAVSIYWKAFVECILQKSFCHVVEQLHATYGALVPYPSYPYPCLPFIKRALLPIVTL